MVIKKSYHDKTPSHNCTLDSTQNDQMIMKLLFKPNASVSQDTTLHSLTMLDVRNSVISVPRVGVHRGTIFPAHVFTLRGLFATLGQSL